MGSELCGRKMEFALQKELKYHVGLEDYDIM